MFPPQGKLAKVGDQAITTHLSLNDKTLKLTVTVETNPAAIPNPEPIV